MKDWIKVNRCLVFLFFIFINLHIDAYDKAPPEIIEFAKNTLSQFGYDPVIINAVKLANNLHQTPLEIKKTEQLWQNKKFSDPQIKHILNSSLSHYLSQFRKKHESIEEVYLLDKKGLLVATAKFEEMYQWGEDTGFKKAIQGALHIGEVRIDEDEQVNMVHVVLPVKDKETVIGAVNIGLLLGKKK